MHKATVTSKTPPAKDKDSNPESGSSTHKQNPTGTAVQTQGETGTAATEKTGQLPRVVRVGNKNLKIVKFLPSGANISKRGRPPGRPPGRPSKTKSSPILQAALRGDKEQAPSTPSRIGRPRKYNRPIQYDGPIVPSQATPKRSRKGIPKGRSDKSSNPSKNTSSVSPDGRTTPEEKRKDGETAANGIQSENAETEDRHGETCAVDLSTGDVRTGSGELIGNVKKRKLMDDLPGGKRRSTRQRKPVLKEPINFDEVIIKIFVFRIKLPIY